MNAGLNIAALAQRTGVAPDTLRKWEQRYRILQPARTAGGQRRYSERDVLRVEWLRDRLSEGYRIGEAASLLGGAEAPALTTSPDEQIASILDSVITGDAAEIGIRLDQAFALHGVETAFEVIVEPLLAAVGERWKRGKMSVAEEHLVSEAVRSRLGNLLADSAGGTRGVAVLACAPGERHELGLMMAAIALHRDGWSIVYLGGDTPVEAALALAARVSARMLGLSLSSRQVGEALERSLREAALPDGLRLVIGGAAASTTLAKRLGAQLAAPSLAATVGALRRLAIPL